jgi:hypothetical protein
MTLNLTQKELDALVEALVFAQDDKYTPAELSETLAEILAKLTV